MPRPTFRTACPDRAAPREQTVPGWCSAPRSLAHGFRGSTIPRPRRALVDEHEDRVDDEEVDDDADEADEAEVEVGTKTAAATTPRAGDEEVESIQDILVKQEARAEEDDDDDSVLSLSREERLEPLA